MRGKLVRFAAALLPICFLSAQQSPMQDSQQVDRRKPQPPSQEALRKIGEKRQRTRAHANAINDLAGHIQSPKDARKLVDLVAAEFSESLPPKWATGSIRNRIGRAEYAAFADSRALIPEQRVADAWNDYLQKIGAPQESSVTAAEIHTLRDRYYVTAQLGWADSDRNIWTVPGIYAIGGDGKVADGCRALEVLNVLWHLANQPELLQGTRELMKKGQRMSDIFKNPTKPSTPGSAKFSVSVRQVPPNPIDIAATQYAHDHGMHALNNAIEDLLKDLFEA